MAGLAQESAQPAEKPRGPCIGFIDQLEASVEVQRARRPERPQPWIVRKLAVFMVFGVLGYTYYVYLIRFCVKMIRRRFDAAGSRGQGSEWSSLHSPRRIFAHDVCLSVAYVVVFNILFLLLLWAYARALFTPPGFARDVCRCF